MVKTMFKRRERYERTILLLLVSMLMFYVLIMMGEGSVTYLSFREKFHWDLKHYTFYSAGKSVTWITLTVLSVYILHKLFKIHEVILLLFGYTLMGTSYIIQGIAMMDWQIYLGALIKSLGSATNPLLRSYLSKIIPTDEIGKIFPLTVALESLMSLIGSPLYTVIYNLTLSTNPTAYNFFSAGLNFFSLFITV